MNIVLRLAWRNIWRQPRRTWLTTGAMVFSNTLLIFMMSLQFGTYELMIDNSLQAFSGHLQVQAPGYKDDMKMRQSVPHIQTLAAEYREDAAFQNVAARGAKSRASGRKERRRPLEEPRRRRECRQRRTRSNGWPKKKFDSIASLKLSL